MEHSGAFVGRERCTTQAPGHLYGFPDIREQAKCTQRSRRWLVVSFGTGKCRRGSGRRPDDPDIQ